MSLNGMGGYTFLCLAAVPALAPFFVTCGILHASETSW